MRRILPDGKGGVELVDVPLPEMMDNSVMCKQTHSLISAGTEREIIRQCSGKSVEQIQKAGIQLGYTGTGYVEDVRGNLPYTKGRKVAFYGSPYVSHSEYVAVPENLVFPLPSNVDLESGAFIGLGAISMHGFRKGGASLGDVCFIGGAGLIGNLCAQLALIAGCRVVLSDFDDKKLELFDSECLRQGDEVRCVTPDNALRAVEEMSDGKGADSVYLCMATDKSAPVDQAVDVVRHGGKIVIVGVCDIHIPRHLFFLKEASVTISRAAGPGRYDPSFERDGKEYPAQYARWSEKENLQETLRLMSNESLKVGPLIFDSYSIDDLNQAYTPVIAGQSAAGIIIKW